MADLGDLRPGAADTTGLGGSIFASPGGATALSDGDTGTFDAQTTNASGDYFYGRALGDTPSDFGTMDSLSAWIRCAWESAPSNSTIDDVSIAITKSDGTTILAGGSSSTFQSIGNPIDDSTSRLLPASGDPGQSFTFVDTSATKADWDGALWQIRVTRTRAKGGDALGFRIQEAWITGAYSLGATQKAGADTGSGADASTAPAVDHSRADTGSGADASSLAVDLTATGETGTGADAVESVGVPINSADTGTGVDASSAPDVALDAADTGSGADAATLDAALDAADTGSGVDVVDTLDMGSTQKNSAETGVGVDASSAPDVALDAAETGVGGDASQLDTGSGVPKNSADTGAGVDAATLVVAITAADTGAGVDVVDTLEVGLAVVDSASAADIAAALDVAIAAAETGIAAEAFSFLVPGMVGALTRDEPPIADPFVKVVNPVASSEKVVPPIATVVQS